MSEDQSYSIVLYDGVCGLCNRLNQFLLKRDHHDRFRFASLQSEFAKDLLERHGLDATDLDTVWVVVDYGTPNERVLARSDAVLHALKQLGPPWALTSVAKILPRPVRDTAYKLVARNRYRIFGKYEVCMMPEERFKHKFFE